MAKKALSYKSTLMYRLHKLAGTLSLMAERELGEQLGISFSQFQILMALEENPLANQREVVQYVGISPGAVSYQLEDMREAGLVEQNQNERSRRENILKLTARGKRLSGAAFKLVEAQSAKLFEPLTAVEQRELGRVLDELIKIRA